MPATIQEILKPTKYRAVDTSTSEQTVSADLIINGDFTGTDGDIINDITGWSEVSVTGGTEDVRPVIKSNAAFVEVDDNGYIGIGYIHSFIAGVKYRVTISAKAESGDTGARIRFQDNGDGTTNAIRTSYEDAYIHELTESYQTFTTTWTANEDSTQLMIVRDAIPDSDSEDWEFYVDNVTMVRLESFGNNNHGQIYSGRGLEFDGVSDYLQGPDDLLVPFMAEDGTFTVAHWIKIDTYADCNTWHMANDTDDRVGGTLGVDGEITFTSWDGSGYTHASGGASGAKAVEKDTWYRVVYVMDSGTKKLYINGILQTETSSAYGSSLAQAYASSSLVIGIGDIAGSGKLFAGKMSDFQSWNTAWTQSDVTFDYLNPESLALNNGGTSLTESNLKLWYPMQDGHRGQQSYILDGANTGLGDEQILNGDFSSYTTINGTTGDSNASGVLMTNWIHQGATEGDGSGACTIESHEGGVKVTTTTAPTSNWHHRLYQNLPLVQNTHYKLSFELKSNVVGSILSRVMKGDSTNIETTSHTIVESDTWESKTCYFHCDFTTAEGIYFYKLAPTAGQYYAVRNVTIKPVNDKHHATSVFLGDEEAVNGDMETFPTLHATNNDTFTDESVDSSQNITMVTETGFKHEGSRSAKCTLASGSTVGYATYNKTDYVIGRTYRAEVYMRQGASQTMTAFQMFADDSIRGEDGTDGAAITPGNSFAIAYVEFVATATTMMINMKFTGTDSHYGYIDNFSIKEIGTATGWTDADQQLDIPQTALQSYNQLAWFDGAGDYITCGANTFNMATFTASLWFSGSDVEGSNNRPLLTFGDSNTSHFTVSTYNQEIYYTYENGAGDVRNRSNDLDLFENNKWYHLIVSNSSGTLTWYVNGEVVTVGTSQTLTAQSCGDLLEIGRNDNKGFYFEGTITEVAIFSTALSQSEVNELYNDGKALDATIHSTQNGNLQGYWRNNGLATWSNLDNPGTLDGTPTSMTETLLLPAGVDASRDNQGFIMNRQKDTNSLNFPYPSNYSAANADENIYAVVKHCPVSNIVSGKFSVSMWIKSHLDNIGGSPGIQNVPLLRFTTDGDKEMFALYWDQNSGPLYKVKYTYQVASGAEDTTYKRRQSSNISEAVGHEEWNHLVITADNTTSTSNQINNLAVVMYLNGSVLSDGGSQSSTPIDVDDKDTFIGYETENGRNFPGNIDDLLVYDDKVLDVNEVDRIYNAGKRSHR